MKTRAAVLRDPAKPFSVEEIDLADPGPGELLVEIAGAGVCHTDLTAREPGTARNALPAVFGHEGSGVIREIGPGVTGFAPGDPVVLSYDSCGRCRQCLSAAPSYCVEAALRNLTGRRSDGGHAGTDAAGLPLGTRWFGQSSFAEYAVATARNAVKVRDDVPLELLGPLGCGVQTGAGTVLLGLGVKAGQNVVIFGAGGVGLSAVMAAVLTGARTVVAVDLHPKRRELALELGATHVVDGADPEVTALVRAATGGAEAAMDTTGVPAVVKAAVESLATGGTCALVGASPAPVTLSPHELRGKKLTYLLEGNAVPQLFIPQLIGHWQAGRFPFDKLIRRYPLDEINQAERDCHTGETVKPILIP
ncbi:zinc-binding dehydrogenase [Actinomadura sp. LD22]|uniref:Zinc-binding dehydrogenase n=1 Tax=Actinomadura physcomitrii TaxID=2650748 RepID=A0A6I4MCX5_9ACTN|nr:NAD(P)-dependent alcohol dehydrogenase [Actinomadura physcomitrii]MWA01631.1 zinc-binding dehydrogenase [Actinomadura physcomitrii]